MLNISFCVRCFVMSSINFTIIEIQKHIQKIKILYSSLLDFIEATEDSQSYFNSLIQILNKQEILTNLSFISELLCLLADISDNHYKSSDFFSNIEQIIGYI